MKNNQIDTERNDYNRRVKKLKGLGNTKGVKWRGQRRNKSF